MARPARVTFTVAAPAPVQREAVFAAGSVLPVRPDAAVGERRKMSDTVLLDVAALFGRSSTDILYRKRSEAVAARNSNATACCKHRTA